MLEGNLPSLTFETDISLGVSNEQLICETQILLLKDAAVTRSLTMEESKKFQIFTDILEKIKSKKKPENPDEDLSDNDLISIVKNGPAK